MFKASRKKSRTNQEKKNISEINCKKTLHRTSLYSIWHCTCTPTHLQMTIKQGHSINHPQLYFCPVCVVNASSQLPQLKYFTRYSEKHWEKMGTEYLETHWNWRTNLFPNCLSETSASKDICKESQTADSPFPARNYFHLSMYYCLSKKILTRVTGDKKRLG